MKKTLTAMALLAGAVSVYSQGQLTFSDYGGSYSIYIYGVQAGASTPVTYNGYTVNEIQGNTSADSSPGSTLYPSGGKLSGSGFTVQVLAAQGSGDALSALTPQGVTSPFYTGGFAGLFTATVSDTLNGVAAGPATMALAAWANTGVDGAAATLAAAQADGYAWGISPLANITLTSAPTDRKSVV